VLFTEVPDGTIVNSTLVDGVWTAPPAPPTPLIPPVAYAQLTPMVFWFAFTYAERILLKTMALTGIPATSTEVAIPIDPIVADFWETYQLAVTLQDLIDPNLPSVQQALSYLSSPTAPTLQIILPDRIAQILAGVPQ